MLSSLQVELSRVSVSPDENKEFVSRLNKMFKVDESIKFNMSENTHGAYTVGLLWEYANAFNMDFYMRINDESGETFVILTKTDDTPSLK